MLTSYRAVRVFTDHLGPMGWSGLPPMGVAYSFLGFLSLVVVELYTLDSVMVRVVVDWAYQLGGDT